MRVARRLLTAGCLGAAALSGQPALAAITGEGLQIANDSPAWPQWQARLAVVQQPLNAGQMDSPLRLGAARLMGDRYLGLAKLGDGGGLRASGALLLGSPALAMGASSGSFTGSAVQARSNIGPGNALDAPDVGATPYLGMGYSAWWARSGLGVSADLGLLAQRTGRGVKLGRNLDGSEDGLRGLQLAPVLQVNLSYAF